MFGIDRKKNRMFEIPRRTFRELEIKEREDLQEWLANTPGALGEELLIIQKEFDGFEETRHRLDLLALDKSGSLVIIENKRDDSGRDVVAQALKYVAYCSSLKKSQIVEIFQDYLKKQKRADESASALICDFLDKDAIEEVNLNSGSGQRFILVAANFGKDVTSTVLWLIANGIRAQCMKAIPYLSNDTLLLDINQIIPTPEAKDYMIGMSSKDKEEKEVKIVTFKNDQLRIKFWEKTLDFFSESNFELYKNVNPVSISRISAGSGISGCEYTMMFGKSELRVEFYMRRTEKTENKRIFDLLLERKQEIEKNFGESLIWNRFDEKNTCQIRFSKRFDGYNADNWPDMMEWLLLHIKQLKRAFSPVIPEIKSKIQTMSQ